MTRPLAIAVACAVCCGCIGFEPHALEPQRSAEAFLARRLDDPALADFLATTAGVQPEAWPPAAWDLDSLTWAALFYSPRLSEARAQWEQARAAIVTAGARPNPTISFMPEYTTSAPSGLSPWVLTPQLDIPIETAGKRAHRVERARRLAEAARLASAVAVWQVRAALRDALVDWTVARRRIEELARQEAIDRDLASLLDARVEAGEIARTDLTNVEHEVVRVRTERSRALADAADAQARAAAAIGVPVSALADLALVPPMGLEPDGHVPAVDPGAARRQALCRRADLLELLQRYEASQAALQLEIAKQYPDVHLGPGYQYDQGEDRWGIGVTVELPVLDRNQGPIAEAEATRKQAAAAFLARQAEILTSVDRAMLRVGLTGSIVRDGGELVGNQTRRRNDVRAAFDAGAADATELALAQADLAASTVVEQQARADFAHALAELEDATQTPLDRIAEPDCTSDARWEIEP